MKTAPVPPLSQAEKSEPAATAVIPATALLTGDSCRSSPAGAVAEDAAAEVSLIEPRPHWPCELLPNAKASPPSTATSE